MTTKLGALLIGALQLVAVQSAQANVNFESTPTSSASSLAFISDGVSFSTTGFHGVTNLSGFGASNGTHFLVYLATNSYSESVSMANQSLFSLSSIDLGGWYNFGPDTQTLTVTGFFQGGGTVTSQLSILPTSFSTYMLNGFNNLQSFQLGSLDRGYVAIDNIIATPVPEPETCALMLAGLGLLVSMAQHRKTA